MTTTIINTTINHGIEANTGNYGIPLTITGSGVVNGNTYGVFGDFSGSIDNAGHINATTFGVLLHGLVTFNNSGSINGGLAGAYVGEAGFINSGVVSGGTIGMLVDYNLRAVNNYGLITGGSVGVEAIIDSSVTNFGIVSGSEAAALVEESIFTNAMGGTVSSSTGIGLAGVDSYIRNDGEISGISTAAGIYGSSGFYNAGTINGLGIGFYLQSSTTQTTPALLENHGVITAFNYGVDAIDGDMLNSGTLYGEKAGVKLDGGTLLNSGIANANTYGVSITTGLLINTGFINGSSAGVYQAGGTFINEATIQSSNIGAILGNTGVLNTGIITGGNIGLRVAGGTVFDSGTISGGNAAIEAGFGLDLAVSAGAVFNGAVQAGSYGTLDLGGTLAGWLDIGGSFSGFNQIDFTGGEWTLEGEVNDLAAGQTITGFGQDDAIDLNGFTATSYSFVSGTGLVLGNGAARETLAIAGNYTTSDFAVANNVYGAVVTMNAPAPCFCAGTRIAAAHGNVPVETLKIGDMVRTAANGLQPILWIGRRSYEGRFIAGNHLALPVKIRRHALGFNVPSRDLFVSPDHALTEGGVLVHAWRFINGVSITQAESVERVEYFHIELEHHAVIFAENTPVESFLDAGCRGRFQNAHTAADGLAAQAPCLPRVEDGYYLARLKARIDARAGVLAPAVTGMLRGCIDEAGPCLRGWAQDAAAPDAPVELELVCNGKVELRFLANRYRADLRKAGLGSGCHAFELALPALDGPFTLRRAIDGAVLEGNQAGGKAVVYKLA